MWRAWIAIACGACTFGAPRTAAIDAEPDGAETPDAPPDAAPDGIDFLPPSEERVGTVNWTIGATTVIDTTALTITPVQPIGVTLELGVQDNGRPVAILRAKDFKINANEVLLAVGDKPLAILAGHDVTIDGTLDVGANGAFRGAGGALGGMGAGAGGISIHDNGTGSTYDDTGAGGGSYGTAGARGGNAGPFLGGGPGATYAIDGLIGGSGGGAAGVCLNPAGAGGGALLLYGGNKITVKGAITAGGGGGAGGLVVCATGSGAGAGGGSGGTIWLQTPDLNGDGVLAANGGGGGGGGYLGISDGGPGQNGLASTTVAAAGGIKANSVEATPGGAGAIRDTAAAGIPDLARGNGGGGGGGLGRIVYRAPDLDTIKSSPDAVTP